MSALTLCCAILALVAVSLGNEGKSFCYAGDCGPTTSLWGGVCQAGKRQSPIVLPAATLFNWSATRIDLSKYKHTSFRIINTGHAIQVDFNGYAPEILLPDPITIGQFRNYRFASAHFHWGANDNVVGSEHCVGIKCGNMEMHLVHYLSSYGSQAAAVASGDENALAVIGVLIDRVLGETPFGITMLKNQGTGPLKPIVDNLYQVVEADHSGTNYKAVNQYLDLSAILYETGIPGINMEMWCYKGSLTTPGCNEQVNWYVMKNPARTSVKNLSEFRRLPKDGNGQTMVANHRPTQPLNGRKVNKIKVLP